MKNVLKEMITQAISSDNSISNSEFREISKKYEAWYAMNLIGNGDEYANELLAKKNSGARVILTNNINKK